MTVLNQEGACILGDIGPLRDYVKFDIKRNEQYFS